MPELRKDPIVDRWTIIAPERALRPNDFRATDAAPSGKASDGERCDLCEGNEQETPGETLAFRAAGSSPNEPGWRVRVVPNRYPAVTRDAVVMSNQHGDDSSRLLPGFGVHEVIIESPRHVTRMSDLSLENVGEVLAAYRHRLVEIKRDTRIVSGLVFKNVGAAGGATLEHVHSQLIALSIPPGFLADELRDSLRLYKESGTCPYCRMIDSERAAGERIVLEAPGFVALCPFAARTPYETWLLPTAHASHFEEMSDERLAQLAQALQQTLAAIENRLERLAYNYVIHTGPFDTPALDHYHWHIEIIPRVTTIAGFEWGSGYAINPLPPETAARQLAEQIAARVR